MSGGGGTKTQVIFTQTETGNEVWITFKWAAQTTHPVLWAGFHYPGVFSALTSENAPQPTGCLWVEWRKELCVFLLCCSFYPFLFPRCCESEGLVHARGKCTTTEPHPPCVCVCVLNVMGFCYIVLARIEPLGSRNSLLCQLCGLVHDRDEHTTLSHTSPVRVCDKCNGVLLCCSG